MRRLSHVVGLSLLTQFRPGEIHSDTTLPRAVLAAENNRQLWLIKYTVSQKKTSTFLFFDQLILIILGMLNPEKIWQICQM